MALIKEKKEEVIHDIRKHKTDTGSPEVQLALLTKRINELSEHLKEHRKDEHSRRGLLQLVSKRRKLIKYLQAEDKDSYNVLADKLGLKGIK